MSARNPPDARVRCLAPQRGCVILLASRPLLARASRSVRWSSPFRFQMQGRAGIQEYAPCSHRSAVCSQVRRARALDCRREGRGALTMPSSRLLHESRSETRPLCLCVALRAASLRARMTPRCLARIWPPRAHQPPSTPLVADSAPRSPASLDTHRLGLHEKGYTIHVISIFVHSNGLLLFPHSAAPRQAVS